MDNHWPSDVVEFGAINITGFRIVDTNRRALRDFHDSRKRLEPHTVGGGNGASLPAISVNVQKNYELLFTIAISIPPLSPPLLFYLYPAYRPRPHSCTTRSLCSSRPSIAFCARSRISFVPIIYSDAAMAAAAVAALAPVPLRMPSTSPAPCWTATHPRVG